LNVGEIVTWESVTLSDTVNHSKVESKLKLDEFFVIQYAAKFDLDALVTYSVPDTQYSPFFYYYVFSTSYSGFLNLKNCMVPQRYSVDRLS
jgi:hypothetical protein